MILQELADSLLNLAYPLHCASCKRSLAPSNNAGVCDHCRHSIKTEPIASGSEHNAYSACAYEGNLKEIIHSFKYSSKVRLGRILSGLMIEALKKDSGILKEVDAITFVPLHRSTFNKRGFNQSQILANNISREFAIPVKDMLIKIKNTRHQNELSRSERLSNLAGAFDIRKGAAVKDKTILLIDDVMTTGTTLKECANILKRSGAKEVRPFTLAKGL